MGWIITLIIGGVIGWLASIVMKTNAQMGLIANVLIGIVGSLLGSSIAVGLGIAPAGSIIRFLIALVGAIALIFILRALGKLQMAAKRIPMAVPPTMAPLAQVNPLSAFRGGIASLFSTHPPTEERIARLEAMARGGAFSQDINLHKDG